MSRLHNLIFLVLSFLSVNLQAIDSNGNFAIWGKGNKSCYSYTVAYDNSKLQSYKDFVMGYLTGHNVQTPDTYRISGKMDLSQILSWLYDYCDSKPIVSFEHALADFIGEHFDKRIKHSQTKFGR